MRYLILLIFLINFTLFAEEKTELAKEKVEPPSLTDKIFFCEKGYSGPANLGWCSDGVYYGPLHLGSVAIAGTNEFYGGFQIGGVAGTDNFYGIAQIGLVAFTISDRRDKNLSGDFYGGFQIAPLLALSSNFYGIAQIGLFAGTISDKKSIRKTGDFYGGFQIAPILAGAGNFHRESLAYLELSDLFRSKIR